MVMLCCTLVGDLHSLLVSFLIVENCSFKIVLALVRRFAMVKCLVLVVNQLFTGFAPMGDLVIVLTLSDVRSAAILESVVLVGSLASTG